MLAVLFVWVEVNMVLVPNSMVLGDARSIKKIGWWRLFDCIDLGNILSAKVQLLFDTRRVGGSW